MSKTRQEVAKSISTYLNKTTNHLFITQAGDFHKIIPFTSTQGKECYAILRWGKNKPVIVIKEQLSDFMSDNYLNEVYQGVKNNCFSSYNKHKSIPNFKAARLLASQMKEVLVTYNGTNESQNDIKSNLISLIDEVTKADQVA